MQERPKASFVHRLLVAAGACALTFLCFLTLPAIQVLAEERDDDLLQLTEIDIQLPPPPPPMTSFPRLLGFFSFLRLVLVRLALS